MSSSQNPTAPDAQVAPDSTSTTGPIEPGLMRLALVAAIAGSLSGLIVGAFRWILSMGQGDYLEMITVLKKNQGLFITIALVMTIGFISVALARWLMRFAPWPKNNVLTPHEAAFLKKTHLPGYISIPVQFIGGLLAMVPQLALGREGPSLAIGAALGSMSAYYLKIAKQDLLLVRRAVCGSGLSVAFNAPLTGALFLFEQVGKGITVRSMTAALVSVGAASAVYRAVFEPQLGLIPVALANPQLHELVIYALMGVLLGWLGAWQNRAIMRGRHLFASTATQLPAWLKAGIIGALFSLLAVFQPYWVGSGEVQVNMILAGQFTVAALVPLMVARWFLFPIAYSLGTPGGLFAPLLFMGAIFGALFADGINFLTGSVFMLDPAAFALVAISAFFAGMIRAPLTGILLICEMSGSTVLLVPLLVATACANVVATMMRNPPIYESLGEKM